MTKYYLPNVISILILAVLFLVSCNGQGNTNSPKDRDNASKQGPEIIGTPPSLIANSNPLNDPSLVGQYIRCIFQDSKGDFWFGPAGQSVVRYNGKSLNYYSKNEFFHGNKSAHENINSVHAIAEDKEGNIWFGTEHGAVKYNPSAYFDSAQYKPLRTSGQTFRSYTEENGLSNINVGRKSILVDKDGNVWVGTAGGVFRYNPSADSKGDKCFSLFQLIPPINVKGIMEDKEGNIWFASQDNGVFRYDPLVPAGQGKAIINITEKEGLGDNYAGGMIQDNAGNIWFTMKGGICRYDANSHLTGQGGFKEITTKDGLGGSEVWGIFMEKAGIIWITARGSTTRYDPSIDISNPKAFTVFTEADGINCCVQSMYQDRAGNMWWGSGAGLYRFDGKRFYQVKQEGPW